MNGKNIRRILILAFSTVFLLLYAAVWHGHRTYVWLNIMVDEKGETQVQLLEQKLPFGAKPELQGEEYTTLCVSWQESYADASWGIFLPPYIELTDVYAFVACEDDGTEVTFDGRQLRANEVSHLGNVEEGVHLLSTDGASRELPIMRGSALPTLWVETETGIELIHEYRQYSTPGSLRIVSAKGNQQYLGEIESLQGRGNSSWSTIKRSYGMKLSEAAGLLGMSSGKSWTLIGGGYDVTGLRNKLFYDMAVECGLNNAIKCEWVNLYIDGSYFGCYLLTEKITVASGRMEIGDLEERTSRENENEVWAYPYYQYEENGRQWTGYSIPHQPADMTGGYLMEMEEYENRFLSEVSRFTTDQGHRVVLKKPKHATLEQVGYISSFVQEFEDALYAEDGYNAQGRYYLDYIDLDSFVKRYLIDEISKNVDVGYSSYFFYKPWNQDKLYAGPVWDYDTALGNNRSWGNDEVLQSPEGMYANSDNWSRELWKKEDFRQETAELFNKLFLPYLREVIDYGLDAYIESIEDTTAMDAVYYGGENREAAAEKLRDFLEKRTDYLEEYFS